MKNSTVFTLALSAAAVGALAMILLPAKLNPSSDEVTAEQSVADTTALPESQTTATLTSSEVVTEATTVTETVSETVTTTISVTEVSMLSDTVTQPAETETPIRTDIIEIDGVTYVQGIMIVNKTYALPASYNPNGLTPETASAFAELQRSAAADGLSMKCVSGFRSFERQTKVYNDFVKRDGQAAADTYSARPGFSEHQSGMALDVNCSSAAFDDTPEAKWLEAHCWEYGFIIRYPRGKEAFTGYNYESSHIRYVGKELAKCVHDSGMCLEELLNIKSSYLN